jgi:hypothetical protein
MIFVAAIDSIKNRADFFYRNSQVDISALGTDVLTTYTSSEDVHFVSTNSGIEYGIILFQYSIMPPANSFASTGQCNITSSLNQCYGQICLFPHGMIIFSEKAITCKK